MVIFVAAAFISKRQFYPNYLYHSELKQKNHDKPTDTTDDVITIIPWNCEHWYSDDYYDDDEQEPTEDCWEDEAKAIDAYQSNEFKYQSNVVD